MKAITTGLLVLLSFLALFAFVGLLLWAAVHGIEAIAVKAPQSPLRPVITEGRIEGIARVFWHQDRQYSLLVQDAEQGFIMKHLACMYHPFADTDEVQPRVIPDVPRGESMWVRTVNLDGRPYCANEIHVHALNDINGAGWTRRSGKNRIEQGTTTVIE